MRYLKLFESFKTGIEKLYKEYQNDTDDMNYKFSRKLRDFYNTERVLIEQAIDELSEFYDASYKSYDDEDDEHFMIYVSFEPNASTVFDDMNLFSNTVRRFIKKVEHEFTVDIYDEFTSDEFDSFILDDTENDGLWDCLNAIRDGKVPVRNIKFRIKLE